MSNLCEPGDEEDKMYQFPLSVLIPRTVKVNTLHISSTEINGRVNRQFLFRVIPFKKFHFQGGVGGLCPR